MDIPEGQAGQLGKGIDEMKRKREEQVQKAGKPKSHASPTEEDMERRRQEFWDHIFPPKE
jgi:hypothetical protein